MIGITDCSDNELSCDINISRQHMMTTILHYIAHMYIYIHMYTHITLFTCMYIYIYYDMYIYIHTHMMHLCISLLCQDDVAEDMKPLDTEEETLFKLYPGH